VLKFGKCLSTEYTNNLALMSWECYLGHRWNASFSNTKNQNQWCKECSLNKRRCGIEACREFAITKNGKCRSTQYKNSLELLEWECEFGHTWNAAFGDIKHHNSWCPTCKKWKSEKELGEHLKKLISVNIKNQYRLPNIKCDVRKIIMVDYYFICDEKEYIVEYNGIQHYEYSEFFHRGDYNEFTKQQERDSYVEKYCDENKIKLVVVDGRKYKNNEMLNYLREKIILKYIKDI
jgi:very-short-patch-repair endonuclease